ncbi:MULTISPECIES: histidine phosphatase family protein [unclassified Mesorhizobium]|uniref:histidine phosphatase family protein n=1 Tax=unclassified Mesorhizobium TaxID=325217 RepID=UPI00333A4A76
MTSSLSSKAIIFFRHGQTDWNREGRVQGHTETDINQTGIDQAEALRLETRAQFAGDIPVFVSPMRRARRTFEILNEGTSEVGDVFYDDRLKEISYGLWEGFTWPEIKARFPAEADQWLADPWDSCPHGGESYTNLYSRLSTFLMELPERSIVISHAGVFQVIAVALGLVSRGLAPLISPPQERVIVLSGRTCLE